MKIDKRRIILSPEKFSRFYRDIRDNINRKIKTCELHFSMQYEFQQLNVAQKPKGTREYTSVIGYANCNTGKGDTLISFAWHRSAHPSINLSFSRSSTLPTVTISDVQYFYYLCQCFATRSIVSVELRREITINAF